MIPVRLVITDPLSPVLDHLGPLSIRWYGVAYAVAFLVGGWLAARHLARRGVPRQVTERIMFWTIVAGLLGARLYFVAQNDPLWYLTHPQHLLAAWEGGMAFFGAVFAALVALLVASWRLRLDFWDLLDAGVLFAAAGQPIGRIGNVMNGEILGPASSLPWAIRYTNPASMAPHLGMAYQPSSDAARRGIPWTPTSTMPSTRVPRAPWAARGARSTPSTPALARTSPRATSTATGPLLRTSTRSTGRSTATTRRSAAPRPSSASR